MYCMSRKRVMYMSRKRVMIEIIDQWHMAQLCTNSSGWLVLQTLLALNILVFRKENFNRESQAVERSRRKEDLVGQKSQQQPRCQVERERERERERRGRNSTTGHPEEIYVCWPAIPFSVSDEFAKVRVTKRTFSESFCGSLHS